MLPSTAKVWEAADGKSTGRLNGNVRWAVGCVSLELGGEVLAEDKTSGGQRHIKPWDWMKSLRK